MQAKCMKGSETTGIAAVALAQAHNTVLLKLHSTASLIWTCPLWCPIINMIGFSFLDNHYNIHNFQEVLLAIPVLILISWTCIGQQQLVLLRQTSHKYGLELQAEMKQVGRSRNLEIQKRQEQAPPQLSSSLPPHPCWAPLWSPSLPGTGCLPDHDASLKWKHLTDTNTVASNCDSPQHIPAFLGANNAIFQQYQRKVGVSFCIFSSRHVFLAPQ